MQQADERAPCDRQSLAAAAAAAAAAVESGTDADQEMLGGDEDSESDVAASVCWTLWCCCERTQVAESGASPGQNVSPAQW